MMPDQTQTAETEANLFRRFIQVTKLDTRMLAMMGALLFIWLVFTIMTDGIFLTPRNLFNLTVQSTVVGIMATGMVLVIVARHIDLSVGSLLGFTGMIIAWLQVECSPWARPGTGR
jgi:D-xylose transport system permease protein